MNINDLPKELRELAILRRKQHPCHYRYSEEEIIQMFTWADTPEEMMWDDVNYGRNIEKHNEYARTIVGNMSIHHQEIY